MMQQTTLSADKAIVFCRLFSESRLAAVLQTLILIRLVPTFLQSQLLELLLDRSVCKKLSRLEILEARKFRKIIQRQLGRVV